MNQPKIEYPKTSTNDAENPVDAGPQQCLLRVIGRQGTNDDVIVEFALPFGLRSRLAA